MHTLDVLKYGHLTVMGAVEDMDEEQWHTPGVCGVWSVREIVAHLTSFEHVLVEILGSLLAETAETPHLDAFCRDQLHFNDVEVAKRAEYTVAQTMTEYEETQARAMELMARIPREMEQKTGILPWYGADYDLQDFLVYSFYGHKREHCAEIAAFRDRLRRDTAANA